MGSRAFFYRSQVRPLSDTSKTSDDFEICDIHNSKTALHGSKMNIFQERRLKAKTLDQISAHVVLKASAIRSAVENLLKLQWDSEHDHSNKKKGPEDSQDNSQYARNVMLAITHLKYVDEKQITF